MIAASATISNPAAHLEALTGLRFETVGEELDWSPRHPRQLIHVASKRNDEAMIAAALQKRLLSESESGAFITFMDSRQGVERLALRTEADDAIRPYRSGYEAADRDQIEGALRDGSLRGVVSTSALEMGIDIPHFEVGLNLSVPTSKKSFLQRIGRIGRNRPGAFAVIGDPYAFKRYGSTLKEYYDSSVEPSYFYLENRFVQYAHARCLADELEMLGVI